MKEKMENITIRLETPEDYRETENLVRETFWDLYKPGCDEHFVLHQLRKSTAFIKELDLVACDENKIVGNIVYSEAKVVNRQSQEFIVLCMGPLSVLSSYQRKGIGSLLFQKTILKAKSLGYKAIILFGNPEYYHRFGFKNAKEYNIQTSDGDNFDAFMALELYNDSLKGFQGKFFADSAFQVKDGEFELYEKSFPYKEKHITPTQIF